MHEILRISDKLGIGLHETIIEESYQKANQFPCEAKCSFHRDFEQSWKPDERDLFGGTIVRLSESLGVDVPVTRRIYRRLESMKQLE